MKTSKVKCATCKKEFEVYGKPKKKVSRKLRKQGFGGQNLLDHVFVPMVTASALGCTNTEACKKGDKNGND